MRRYSGGFVVGCALLAFGLGGMIGWLLGPGGKGSAADAHSRGAGGRFSLVSNDTGTGREAGPRLRPSEAFARFSEAVGSGDDDAIRDSLPSLTEALEFDPGQTLARALEIEEDGWRTRSLGRILAIWMAKDPGAAEAALRDIENVRDRRIAFQRAIGETARLHPDVALRLVESQRSLAERGLYAEIFSHWGASARHRADALAALEGIESRENRQRALEGLSRAFAETAVDEGLAWADSLSSAEERDGARARIFRGVASREPEEAARIWLENRETFRDGQHLRLLVESWAGRDLEAAAAWVEAEVSGEDRSVALAGIARRTVDSDPARAAGIAAGLPPGKDRQQVWTRIGALKAVDDPHEAVAWLNGLEGSDQMPALRGMVDSWARFDPAEAAVFAGGVDDAKLQGQLADRIVKNWIQDDPAAAAQWAAALPGGNGGPAMRSALQEWMDLDAASASTFLGGLGESQAKTAAVGEVTRELVREDVSRAADWVSALGEGEARTRAVGEVASRWVKADPMEASRWIASLDGGPSRDAAVVSMIDQIEKQDPASAIAWAETLGDTGLRQSWVRRLEKRLR